MSGAGPDPSCASAQQARQRAIWATLALVIVAQVCVHAAMSGTRLAAPLALLQAGYSQALVGMLLSLFAAGPIALSLHAGRWADQWGYHRPVYFAIGATVLGTFLAFASLSVWAWCLSALLTGTATSFALVSAQRQAGRVVERAGHARDVAQRRRRSTTLVERSGGFAFEVEHHPVSGEAQHLTQVQVTVDPDR